MHILFVLRYCKNAKREGGISQDFNVSAIFLGHWILNILKKVKHYKMLHV